MAHAHQASGKNSLKATQLLLNLTPCSDEARRHTTKGHAKPPAMQHSTHCKDSESLCTQPVQPTRAQHLPRAKRGPLRRHRDNTWTGCSHPAMQHDAPHSTSSCRALTYASSCTTECCTHNHHHTPPQCATARSLHTQQQACALRAALQRRQGPHHQHWARQVAGSRSLALLAACRGGRGSKAGTAAKAGGEAGAATQG